MQAINADSVEITHCQLLLEQKMPITNKLIRLHNCFACAHVCFTSDQNQLNGVFDSQLKMAILSNDSLLIGNVFLDQMLSALVPVSWKLMW